MDVPESSPMVAEFRYDIGREFEIRKSSTGISLKVDEVKPKTILRKKQK